jgi:hypothetical protein
LKYKWCTKLCPVTLFLNINYLFNQMIIKTDIYENDWIKSKHKKYIMQACIYLEKML